MDNQENDDGLSGPSDEEAVGGSDEASGTGDDGANSQGAYAPLQLGRGGAYAGGGGATGANGSYGEAGGSGSAGSVIVSSSFGFSTSFYSGGAGGPLSPQEEKLEHEIVCGEIIAWRVWRIMDDKLTSVAVNVWWLPGVPMHGDVKNHFGVHAWKTREDALEYAGYDANEDTVIGNVELWGEVIEHEHGYRAEYAAVADIELKGNPLQWLRLSRLRSRYCPHD